MKKHFSKENTPLILTIILVIISLCYSIFGNYVLSLKHYIGFSLILMSFLAYFSNKRIYSIIFAISLTLGLIGLIDIFFIEFAITIIFIKINLVFLILLILFLVTNKEKLNKLFPEKNT
jgi:hypothetical protein